MTEIHKDNGQLIIDDTLVNSLLSTQFPQWASLAVRQVARSGWDNRTFHLGDDMLVRMPSAEKYASQVEKEQYWLPKLAPLLPLSIPEPLAMGRPVGGYPYHWSIYRWIKGNVATKDKIGDLNVFANDLAQFLVALQSADPANGPSPGWHNFYRGGSLSYYDDEVRQAIDALSERIDIRLAVKVWETALDTAWNKPPVWVHGDVSAGNLLLREGRLVAVIDFGMLAVGDPACDLSIAWTLFEGESRGVFRSLLPLDDGTWARGRAWTLWKALIIAAGVTDSNTLESTQSWRIIDEVLSDHR